MVLVHSAFLPACALEVALSRPSKKAKIRWTGVVGALIAQGLRYWAVSTLGRRWSTRIVVFPGRAPVQAGPYRWMRHPNYLAVVLEMASVPLAVGAWRTAILFSALNAWLLSARIPLEERALGPQYLAAFERTHRLMPRRDPAASSSRVHPHVRPT
jgi:methyltransferase